jgi:hypothetical protein
MIDEKLPGTVVDLPVDETPENEGISATDAAEAAAAEAAAAEAAALEAAKPTLADAINKAIEEVPGAPKKEDEKVPDEQPDTEVDADLHQIDAKGKPVRDPKTGKFLPKEGTKEEKKEDEPELDADGKPKVKEPDKKPDALDDKEDPKWSEKTQLRFRDLSSRVKVAEAKAEESNQFFQQIASTGASPDQFARTIQYLRLVHSKDPAERKLSFTLLLNEVKGMALELGEPVPGMNFLDEYPDLRKQVDEGQLSEKNADELARTRARAKLAADTTTATEATAKQTNDDAVARNEGIAALNALGTKLSTDPDYGRKYKILIQTLKPVIQRLHPSKWAETYQAAYDNIPALVKATVTPIKDAVKPKGPQPLRPKSPSGQGSKQPGSMLEAINAGLEDM